VDHHVQLIQASRQVGRDLDPAGVVERAVLARHGEAVERKDRIGARVSACREGDEHGTVVVEAFGGLDQAVVYEVVTPVGSGTAGDLGGGLLAVDVHRVRQAGAQAHRLYQDTDPPALADELGGAAGVRVAVRGRDVRHGAQVGAVLLGALTGAGDGGGRRNGDQS
jgi:hypothetical protein